ncbi:MAG: hypothetical protein Q7R83_04660 [bacterium]|nr:hypothetical protein [bacterium]
MKHAVVLLLAIGLAITCELVFQPFLPTWLQIHPFIPVLILLLITQKRRYLYATLLVGGFLLDAYAPEGKATLALRLLLVIPVLEYAAEYWLTNRSLYTSLLLIWTARLAMLGLGWLFHMILYWIGQSALPPVFDLREAWVFAFDTGLMIAGFLMIATWTRALHESLRPRGADWITPSYGSR